MRILQIASSDGLGGAARSAFRLHRGLSLLGQQSRMLVKDKHSDDNEVAQAAVAGNPREIKWMQKFWVDQNRTSISSTYFSLPAPGYDISRHPEVLAADVLHLHWVTGFLSPPSLASLQRLGKPVFWTLHDQRPLTGGCHFTASCRNYERICSNCPQLRNDDLDLARASQAESGQSIRAADIVIVAPSEWMARCAAESALFGKSKIHVIPYGIDTAVFRPQSRARARELLNLAPEGIYFALGADNIADKRKGFQQLMEALGQCRMDRSFRVLCMGAPGPELMKMPAPATSFGRVDNDEQLARIYAAADAFILPSLEDNLPNMLLESVCCGTPVIGFATGGIPDVIRHGESGLLAPTGDCPALAAAMEKFAADGPLRKRLGEVCARTMPQRFSLQTQAATCMALYERATRTESDRSARISAVASCPLMAAGPAFASVFKPLLKKAEAQRRLQRWKNLKTFLRTGFAHRAKCG